MRRAKPNEVDEVIAAVVAAAAEDATQNSEATDAPPGVTVDGAVTVVVGSNGRRVMIADTHAGVFIGGALIEDRAHLGQVVRVLSALYERRWE